MPDQKCGEFSHIFFCCFVRTQKMKERKLLAYFGPKIRLKKYEILEANTFGQR